MFKQTFGFKQRHRYEVTLSHQDVFRALYNVRLSVVCEAQQGGCQSFEYADCEYAWYCIGCFIFSEISEV